MSLLTNLRATGNWLLHSLFVRIIATALLIMVLAATFRYFYTQHKLAFILKSNAIAQQQELVSNFSQALSQKIVLRQQVLQNVANNFPPELLINVSQREAWMHMHQLLLAPLFSDLLLEKNITQDAADIILVNNSPTLTIVLPIRDASGHPVAYLRGDSLLTMPSLFGDLNEYKNGQQGGFLILLPNMQRYIVLAQDRVEISELATALERWSVEKILNSVHTALDAKLDAGVNASSKVFAETAVPNTQWVAAAYISHGEVILSTREFLQNAANVSPIIILVFIILAGAMMFYFLRPLTVAAVYADKMTRGEIPLAPLPVGSNDELGALTKSFNRLINNVSENANELIEQRKLAENAAASKSRFLAAASHDLRQPMHALNLYLGALAHFDLPENARSALINARECAQTMDDMFRALLDISKLDAQVVDINISVFPIALLLEKIRKEYSPQAEAKGLHLNVVACSLYVRSDPELLERILRNLVSNAVRYTASGKVLVGCRRSAGGLQLHVYDTGAGIAFDHQKAIFEEFYQASNPGRDREQGLGLGLAIVQRLALLLQSPLKLVSQLGCGSNFSVGLERANESISTPEQVDEGMSHLRTLEGALIAVVDDEILILNATSMLMKQWGCSVISAVSGTELFELLAVSTRVPDALVCDYRLRDGETGIGVIDLLRDEFNTDIPALLITGDTSQDQIQIMLEAQLPILHKPLQDHVLKAALIKLINKQPT